MFIIVDPAGQETERQRYLRLAQIKSHAAQRAHQNRSKEPQQALRSSLTRNKISIRLTLGGKSQRVPNDPKRTGLQHGLQQSRHTAKPRTHSETRMDTDPADESKALCNSAQMNTNLAYSLNVHRSDLNTTEIRAVHFFLQNTASQWSGWNDASFWMELVPRASYNVRAIRHAMVSLGANHESLEHKDQLVRSKSRALAILHGKKVLELLAEDHDLMSLSTLLLVHVLLVVVTCNLEASAFIKSQNLQFDLFDHITQMLTQNPSSISREEIHLMTSFLTPLIRAQQSKTASYIDPILCLANAPSSDFGSGELPRIPAVFVSIVHAHDVLESLLKHAAYVCKTECVSTDFLPCQVEADLERWDWTLENFVIANNLCRRERCDVSLLRCAAGFGRMMILTMNTQDEMVFDRHTELYRNLLCAYREAASCKKDERRIDANFGLSPGLLTLTGQTIARWCRDPFIRGQLIDELAISHRRDGYDGSALWARIGRAIQDIEETGIHPRPKVSADIPSINRVIIKSVSFYEFSLTIKIEILRDPWGLCTVEELLIPRNNDWQRTGMSLKDAIKGRSCSVKMHRKSAAKIDEATDRVFDIENPRFVFPMPRL